MAPIVARHAAVMPKPTPYGVARSSELGQRGKRGGRDQVAAEHCLLHEQLRLGIGVAQRARELGESA